MDSLANIAILKRWLLRDVAYLSRRSDLRWNGPIVETARELKRAGLRAVYFGGTLRSLLLGRLSGQRNLGRPRDLDIVVAGNSIEELRERLEPHVVRQTRFGGLKIERSKWQFDVWPLQQTWAFREDESLSASFTNLPNTTFFNIEAIAVDVWAKPSAPRRIYSGDDRFFHGLLNQTIEMNRESNPYPALCVVRSLVMAKTTGFAIGPRLGSYLAAAGDCITDRELDEIQIHHYGTRRLVVADMRRQLEHVAMCHDRLPSERITLLPLHSQLTLWDEEAYTRLHFHFLSGHPRCDKATRQDVQKI